MIQFVEFEAYLFIGLCTIVPLIDIRIPPFPSYFFCRSVFKILSKDPCCLAQSDCSSGLLNAIMVNIVRIVSGVASALFFSSIGLEATQMIIYEVFFSLVFFSSCLKQIKAKILNTNVQRFNVFGLKYIMQLQLLNQAFNNIYQTGVFAVYFTAIMMIAILSGAFFLKIHRDSITLALLAFVFAFACYICLFVFLSFASKVWTGSESISTTWKKNPQLMKNPVTRRVRMSVRNMKINIGAINFIERMTALVVLSFCAEQTVTLILLGN
jgi:hypothetical protein